MNQAWTLAAPFVSLALASSITLSVGVASAAAPAGVGVQETLRKAVADAADQLGALEPWQKELWAEVLENYSLFVRDYRASASGVQVDVDLDAIKNYLGFQAQKTLKREENRFLVFVRPARDCEECKGTAESIRGQLKTRLARRGFKPWIPSNPSKEVPPLKWFWNDQDAAAAQAFETGVFKFIQEADLSGAAFVSLEKELPPPDDTAHADEVHFVTRTYFIARAGTEAVRRERTAIHQGRLDTRDPGGFGDQVGRLTSDALIEWGGQSESLASGAEGPARFEVSVAGIPDFSRYLAIRSRIETALLASLKDMSGFVERKMWRGGVVFGFRTRKTVDVVKAALSGLALEPGNLAVVEVQDHLFKAEVR